MSPVPTVGRTVHFTLDSCDADMINKRRADATSNLPEHHRRAEGTQLHIGNGVAADDVYPMVITRVWGDPHDTLAQKRDRALILLLLSTAPASPKSCV